jgi:hypothetical protein
MELETRLHMKLRWAGLKEKSGSEVGMRPVNIDWQRKNGNPGI